MLDWLFKNDEFTEFRIRSLEEKLYKEIIDRAELRNTLINLEKKIKAMEKEQYDELQEKFYNDSIGTMKEIYDKYKYKKLNEVPSHIRALIIENTFCKLNNEENRTIGQILEDEIMYNIGIGIKLSCYGCEKDKPKEDDCKCGKKKGKKK